MEFRRTVLSLNFILVLGLLLCICTGFFMQGIVNREGGDETYRKRYHELIAEYSRKTPEEAKAAVDAYKAYVEEQTALDPMWIIEPEHWAEKGLMEQIEKQVNYLSFYPEYLKKIHTEAERIRSVSIFSEPGTFVYENTIRTEEDFGKLGDTEIVLGHDLSVTSVFIDPAADYALIILVVFVCALFLQERRQGLWELVHGSAAGRRKLALRRCLILLAVSIVGSLVLIGSRILFAGIRYEGLNEMGRALQSVEMFYNVPYRMTVGQFFLFYLCVKAVGTFLIGLLLWLILSSVSHLGLASVIAALVLGLEFGLSFLSPSSSLVILKYLNIFSLIRFDQIFIHYLNLPFFGGLINGPVLVLTAMVPGIVLLITANVLIAEKKHPVGKENALVLFADRVLQKLESLKRPAPLFAWEGYKLWIKRGGLVILVIMVIWASRMEAPFKRGASIQDLKFSKYRALYEGPVAEEVIGRIKEDIDQAASEEEKNQLSAFLQSVRELPEGAWIMNTEPYEAAFSDNVGNIQRTAALTAILFLVLLTFPICSQDRQAGMEELIQASPGRKKQRSILAAYCILNAAVVWLSVYGFEILHTQRWYGTFGAFRAPALSIPGFEGVKLTIGTVLVIYYVLKLLVLISISLVIRFLSSQAKTNRNALLLNLSVLVLPAVLVTLKIHAAEPFSFVLPLAGVEVMDKPWVFAAAVLAGAIAWCLYTIHSADRSGNSRHRKHMKNGG